MGATPLLGNPVPPRDARECPALERSLPAGAPEGSPYRDADAVALVPSGHGTWRRWSSQPGCATGTAGGRSAPNGAP
jgi:hypothetical protein